MGLINIHIHHDEEKLELILRNQNLILKKLEQMAKSLADVQADVTAEDTVVDSAITLLKGLAAQVAALQPNQAAIDALAADIEAKTASLSQAVVDNTPAA